MNIKSSWSTSFEIAFYTLDGNTIAKFIMDVKLEIGTEFLIAMLAINIFFLTFFCLIFSFSNDSLWADVIHYEPEWPIWSDVLIFNNFRFSKLFLAQIHLAALYFHKLCLKSLGFAIKYIIILPKLGLKHCFFHVSKIYLVKNLRQNQKKIQNDHFRKFSENLFCWVY